MKKMLGNEGLKVSRPLPTCPRTTSRPIRLTTTNMHPDKDLWVKMKTQTQTKTQTKTKPHNRETKSTHVHLHVAYQNESTLALLPNVSSNPGIWTRNLAVSKKRRSRNLGGMVVQGLKVQSSGCEPVYLTVRRPNFSFDLAFPPHTNETIRRIQVCNDSTDMWIGSFCEILTNLFRMRKGFRYDEF